MNKLLTVIRRNVKLLFTIYMGILIFVIIFKFPTLMVKNTIIDWMNGGEVIRLSPKLIPFDTIIFYVRNVHSLNDWFIKNLAVNIVMFLPYGFLVPFFVKDKKKVRLKVILTGCILSIGIELFQYVTALGQCDIDDVILNTVGVILGLGVYRLMYLFYKDKNSNEA